MSEALPPLTSSKVAAAGELHDTLSRWVLTDSALRTLRDQVDGFDEAACVLKVVTLNDLYGTNVYTTVPLAQSMSRILAGKRRHELVSETLGSTLAVLPGGNGDRVRTLTSFASKFCHFFIDEHRFPIYDEAACASIKAHLGKSALTEDGGRYELFCAAFRQLQKPVRCTTKTLDHYLWIAGMYLRWSSGTAKAKYVNRELSELFDQPGARSDLLMSVVADSPKGIVKKKPRGSRG